MTRTFLQLVGDILPSASTDMFLRYRFYMMGKMAPVSQLITDGIHLLLLNLHELLLNLHEL